MMWKCVVVGIFYGGAKGGVVVDFVMLSCLELERVIRCYANEILSLIGLERDVSAPDVGTDEQTMAWIMDIYFVNAGYSVLGVVMGKLFIFGGSVGCSGVTVWGVVIVIFVVLKEIGCDLCDCTVAV